MASENTAGYDSAKRQKYISIKGDGKRNNDGNGYGLNSPEKMCIRDRYLSGR